MTERERELFFELARKFKDDKRAKDLVSIYGRLKFLALLVGFLIFLLVIIHLI